MEQVPSGIPEQVRSYLFRQLSKLENMILWSDHSVAGTETDPVFAASAAASITTTHISNWNSAFSWGNHAAVGYLTGFTESDPVFSASAASSITSTDKANWNNAFSWGDHSHYYWTNPLAVGSFSIANFGAFDTKLSILGAGASVAGRTVLGIQNTNSTSAEAIGLFNNNNSKRLFFLLSNSGYVLPNLAALTTEGNTPFYFITDGDVASGRTSNIYFRIGGYDTPAGAFAFTYQKRLGIATTTPSYDVSFGGTAAKQIGIERHTTANTAGVDLTVSAGGATVGATDKAGGSTIISGGIATGSGESGVQILTAVSGAAGTADRNPTNVAIQALGDKLAFNGATPVTKPNVSGSRGGNAALASLLTALAQLGLITDSTTA